MKPKYTYFQIEMFGEKCLYRTLDGINVEYWSTVNPGANKWYKISPKYSTMKSGDNFKILTRKEVFLELL